MDDIVICTFSALFPILKKQLKESTNRKKIMVIDINVINITNIIPLAI